MNKRTATLALAIIMASTAFGARPVARVGTPLFANSGFERPAALKANWDQYKELALECSALKHVSKGDPNVYVRYTGTDPVPTRNPMGGINHDMFGRILKENGDESGIRVESIPIVHRSRRRSRRPK